MSAFDDAITNDLSFEHFYQHFALDRNSQSFIHVIQTVSFSAQFFLIY